jgi:thioredoxin 2
MSIQRACETCGATNNIPARHLAHRGKCGACKAALGPQATPLQVDQATFEDIVAHASQPILVDFYADWCGPCRAAAPHVDKVARQSAGRALVLKVNTDQQPALAARFGVRSIPNFVVLKEGRTAHQQAGMADAGGLQRMLGL